MPHHHDAASLAQLALQLGLLTESQMREAFQATAQADPPIDSLVRAMERLVFVTPWQTQKLLKCDKDGYYLHGYMLLYRIASGSFGRVFRAKEPNNGVVVAVKVLRRRWSEQRRTIELFEREGKIGLTLRHPNIVSILAVDFDRASRQYYIVMEFVEGGNLRDFLKIRKRLGPAEALRILEDCVSGLAHAYSQGFTHRDVKLTNILISSGSVAKLVDFGLADIYALQDRDDDNPVDRTVDYAGFEQATGVKAGDVRSDIYFLGCVFFEMLTGRSPILLTRIKHERMRRDRFINAPSLRGEEVLSASPEALQAATLLVERMMALNPNQRYQTPAQLLEAVRDARRVVDGKLSISVLESNNTVNHVRPVVAQSESSSAPPSRSVFVVEKKPKLQDALRDGFKQHGYRVFISADASVALSRYRQQPYDALLVDAGSVGMDGLHVLDRVVDEAHRRKRAISALVIFSSEQEGWTKLLPESPTVAAIVRPAERGGGPGRVTLGLVIQKLGELLPPLEKRAASS